MSSWTHTPSGKTRARGAGIPFQGKPGLNNAITDVEGVQVGYTTLIEGESIRTGVTGILPRPKSILATPVFAGSHSLNGNGELTGTIWMEEAGQCNGPITITNTHSCGIARDASIKWLTKNVQDINLWSLPVAGETYDGQLNDINGFHIKEEHVFNSLDKACGGPIDEGSVGGGTGMICYDYKGGSGTSSRRVQAGGTEITIGAFVQANFGLRHQLTIAGVPVGRSLGEESIENERGSIIGIIATDAPLLPHQLKRLARRVSLGVGRSGAISGHGSGDIFMAFSTANAEAFNSKNKLSSASFVPDERLDKIFEAVIQSIDEAILNALFANETMKGINGRIVEALPHGKVLKILQDQNRG
jgi:D-aminopeptidase